MNELYVLAQELAVIKRLDLIHGLAGTRDVHRDRQPELAGIVDFRLIHFGLDRARAELAAPCHAERDEALVRPALPIPGEALDRPLVGRLGVGQTLRPTAGMAGANTDLGERADVRLGVGRAAHVVAPGMHEGHSGIDRLRGRKPRALKDVIRSHLLAETRDGREIAFLRLVAGEAAVERVPHMPMGLDQAGHDDHARAVDLLPAALHILADRDDLAVAHVDRAAGDIAERAVHRHHMGIGDGEFAARRQLRGGSVAAPRLRHQRR